MSIFSDKKTIDVSSTLYNMAGPEEDRPDYMKGTIFSSVLNNAPYIGEAIQDSYFEGPGLSQRLFYRYAVRQNYDGFPNVSASGQLKIDPAVVEGEIPLTPGLPGGTTIYVQEAYLDDGDLEIFVEKWILENHSSRIGEDWTGDYDSDTGELSVVFPNADEFTWTDPDFDPSAEYLVARYFEILPNDNGTEDLISSDTDVLVGDLPDTTGYSQVSGTAPEGAFEKYEWVGSWGVTQEGIYKKYVITEQDSADWADSLIKEYDWEYYEQTLVDNATTGEKLFIYKLGGANTTLNAFQTTIDTADFQEFYPILPLRLKNRRIDHPDFLDGGPGFDLYEQTRKMYRRAFNYKNIQDLLSDLDDNENIDDIDFAYILWGASLNTRENASRRYIYEFFKQMIQFQVSSSSAWADLQADIASYDDALEEYNNWKDAQSEEDSWESRQPPPPLPQITPPATTRLKLEPDSDLTSQYPNLRIEWIHIEESGDIAGKFTFTEEDGVTTRDARFKECELRKGSGLSYQELIGTQDKDGAYVERTVTRTIPSMIIYQQIDVQRDGVSGSQNIYRTIEIFGLVHRNIIYDGKGVTITSSKALDDDEPSGFLIPLHEPTFKALGIVDYTQMATANCHILINAYTVTTQKWYERTIFKILLVLVVLVVAVIIAPGAFAAGGGILGTNLAVGTAAGLTGTAAIVAGVVANYIAGIIVSMALQAVSTGLFGEKWGAVFAAIVSFGFGLMMSGTSLFSAEGILGLTNAVSNGYQGFVRGSIMEMQEEMKEEYEDFQKEYERVDKLMKDLMGGNDLNFNPITLTDSTYGTGNRGRDTGYLPETADEFVSRTTMTGTDIVDATFAMVYRYTDISRTLPRN